MIGIYSASMEQASARAQEFSTLQMSLTLEIYPMPSGGHDPHLDEAHICLVNHDMKGFLLALLAGTTGKVYVEAAAQPQPAVPDDQAETGRRALDVG